MQLLSINCKGNVDLKIYPSHARDIMEDVILVLSLSNLVHYFQNIHDNDIFALKGVKIDKV